MKLLSLLILAIFCTISSTAFATIYYRHIPLTVSLKSGDKLIVNYDFAGKAGIRCIASSPNTWVHFIFKGHAKTARLPITLQNAHIPHGNREALADIEGQFSVSTQEPFDISKHYIVNCNYTG